MTVELAEDRFREDYVAYLDKKTTVDVVREDGKTLTVPISEDIRSHLLKYLDFFFEEIAGDQPLAFANILSSYTFSIESKRVDLIDLYYGIGYYLYGSAIYTYFLPTLTQEQADTLKNEVRSKADDLFDSTQEAA